MVTDNDGVWRSVNPAWHKVLGWTAAELVGRTSQWLVHPDDYQRTRLEQRRLAAGHKVSRLENRFRHRDGSYRWLSWSAAPDDGLIYCAARDITDDKKAAENLQRAEEALRQSQKMEAVGQLTGGIAHDFNNLLQGIIGSLDIAKRRIDQGRPEDILRFVDGATSSANRAAALTHRLLAFSRRQPLDPRPVDANQLLTSMEDLLRRTMGERIEIKLEMSDGLWLTRCDPNQLESALLNLAINARDAMPDGGALTIATHNIALDDESAARQRGVRPGQYVCLLVRDTGIGMAPEVKAPSRSARAPAWAYR